VILGKANNLGVEILSPARTAYLRGGQNCNADIREECVRVGVVTVPGTACPGVALEAAIAQTGRGKKQTGETR